MIVVGDAIERLRELKAGSVQTCITSPPYFGLRDYGTGEWEGGDEGCDHSNDQHINAAAAVKSTLGVPANGGKRRIGEANSTTQFRPYRDECGRCGARRVDRQLGLESTPDEYVTRLVDVFREVRRVLRDDGTVWLNLGDSYAATSTYNAPRSMHAENRWKQAGRGPNATFGAKPKDLIGIPWRVALALQADGWWLRSDIVWSKPNPMPESVTDRPTRAHEFIFLLSKSARYFYDANAVREPLADKTFTTFGTRHRPQGNDALGKVKSDNWGSSVPERKPRLNADGSLAGANKRSVWNVATHPFPGAHFAVFPPRLIEPCVLAGSPPKCCGECGAPWVREVERTPMAVREGPGRAGLKDAATGAQSRTAITGTMLEPASSRTTGWRSTCVHDNDQGRSVVLDPFAGSGTVGVVCRWHGRDFIGIELNPEYAAMAEQRIQVEGNQASRHEADEQPPTQMALFDESEVA